MLSYELCKKLKDAGWSQEFSYGDCGMTPEGGYTYHDEHTNDYLEENEVKIPSLSELIEACIEGVEFGFDSLVYYPEGSRSNINHKWEAYAKYDPSYEDGNRLGTGEAPEEAVANLWLELNKK